MPELKIKRPCNDCPFRRTALPGWLGEGSADDFVKGALADYADYPLPCHLTIDYNDEDWRETQYENAALCAGALIFCRNNAKSPRDPQRNGWVMSVDADKETVFSRPWEFYEHHGEELPEEVARMKHYHDTGSGEAVASG